MANLQIETSRKELASLLRHLDKQDKGYMDFRDFSTLMGPGMSEKIQVESREVHLPNLYPSRAKMNEYGSKTGDFNSKMKDIR